MGCAPAVSRIHVCAHSARVCEPCGTARTAACVSYHCMCAHAHARPCERSCAPRAVQEIIDAVNSAPGASWVAGVNPRFEGMTLGQVKTMLGTKRDPKSKSKARLGKSTVRDSAVGLPTSFDVRTNWPQCANVTGHIRDQSSCGSCWAFGSTEAFNDRMCIAYNYNRLLSPTDTMACCNADNGCYSSVRASRVVSLAHTLCDARA